MMYLLFFFSMGLFVRVQSAQCGELERNHPPAALDVSQGKTATDSPIAIKPVGRKKSDRFNETIETAAARYKIEPALIKAVIMAESAYDPKAVSKQGAKGLMQLMPKTARALGVKNAFDPVHNINGGVKYLRQMLDAFDHNVELALAAYNAGAGKVKRHGGIPPIKATRHYVNKVFAYYQHYKSEMAAKTEKV